MTLVSKIQEELELSKKTKFRVTKFLNGLSSRGDYGKVLGYVELGDHEVAGQKYTIQVAVFEKLMLAFYITDTKLLTRGALAVTSPGKPRASSFTVNSGVVVFKGTKFSDVSAAGNNKELIDMISKLAGAGSPAPVAPVASPSNPKRTENIRDIKKLAAIYARPDFDAGENLYTFIDKIIGDLVDMFYAEGHVMQSAGWNTGRSNVEIFFSNGKRTGAIYFQGNLVRVLLPRASGKHFTSAEFGELAKKCKVNDIAVTTTGAVGAQMKILPAVATDDEMLKVASDVLYRLRTTRGSSYGNPQVDQPQKEGSRISVGIRDWGTWINDSDEEDYDWEKLSRKSADTLSEIVSGFSKQYTNMEIYWQSGEKNWIYVYIEPKKTA